MKEHNRSNYRLSQTTKLVLTGVLSAIAIIGSTFSFPILGSKCAPVQHLINIITAVVLGPSYAVGAAFIAALLRNLLGLGTVFAFPGSMCGALLAGLLYKYTKKLPFAYIGELVGTSIIGGLAAYPIASYVLGNQKAALLGFIPPFFISTAGGTILAIIIISACKKKGILPLSHK